MGIISQKIKNDFWHINYIIPFIKKYRDSNDKTQVLKAILKAFMHMHPVRGNQDLRSVAGDTFALMSKVKITLPREGQFIYSIDTSKTIAVKGNVLNNFPIDYSKVILHAFKDYMNVISSGNDDNYIKDTNLIFKALDTYCKRVVTKLKSLDFDEQWKIRRIHDFSNMLYKPAEHFDEALQRILFFNQAMWQTRHRLNGLGMLDRILTPYYEKDIKCGYLRKNEAQRMINEFLNCLTKYYSYKSDALEGDIGQIIVLGGMLEDGSYFCSDVTEMFLISQAKAKKPDPKTLLRVSRNMPDSLLELAVDCLTYKTGSPLFANDDVICPLLQDFGFAKPDTYYYTVSACWEPFIVGKSFDQNNIAVFDFFTALDQLLIGTPDVSSFKEFIDQYRKINRENFESLLKSLDEIKWAKDPLVSILTDGCNEKQQDISEGGAIYNNFGITTVGLSNTVDSLLNIKELVFDSNRYRIDELNEIRLNNFDGNAQLFNRISLDMKHFGHDEIDVIDLISLITEDTSGIARAYKNHLGGTVKYGFSSPDYLKRSKHMNADLAGRKKGMPYNTHISCANGTYTELVRFASQLDYSNQRFNGNVVDFFISPDFLKNNMQKFTTFIKGSILSGFFEMQMNVIDSKTLIDAKKNPSKYPDLIVRVWGFSAYFNDLPEEYKERLIERAIQSERAA